MYCRGESSAAVTRWRSEARLMSGSVKSDTGATGVWARAAERMVNARPAKVRGSLMPSNYRKPGSLSSGDPAAKGGDAVRPAVARYETSSPPATVPALRSCAASRLKSAHTALADLNTVTTFMNPPAQVFAALAVAGAVSFLPLGTRFRRRASLGKRPASGPPPNAPPGLLARLPAPPRRRSKTPPGRGRPNGVKVEGPELVLLGRTSTQIGVLGGRPLPARRIRDVAR